MFARSRFASIVVPRQCTSFPTGARALVGLSLLLASLSGCSAVDGASENELGTSESALYEGERDEGAGANEAVVALRIGEKSPFELCTGTLIAPNVVLTARHCVSKNTSNEIDCDEAGQSHNGSQVGEDVSPKNIHVMLGTSPDFGAPSAARGRLVFRPAGDTLCNTDIAIVVLDRSVPDVQPMAVRSKGGVVVGESFRAVGYGENDQKTRIGTRFRKDGVRVLTMGPASRDDNSGRPAVADREFEVGKSICQGDSGGPAISERTGAVIGVVSRGVGCTTDFGHIYTTTVGFGTLFREAFAAAGASPIPEAEFSGAQGFAVTGDESDPGVETSGTTRSVGLSTRQEAERGGGCDAAPSRENDRASALAFASLSALAVACRRRRRTRASS